jgi:hypothetical protein
MSEFKTVTNDRRVPVRQAVICGLTHQTVPNLGRKTVTEQPIGEFGLFG